MRINKQSIFLSTDYVVQILQIYYFYCHELSCRIHYYAAQGKSFYKVKLKALWAMVPHNFPSLCTPYNVCLYSRQATLFPSHFIKKRDVNKQKSLQNFFTYSSSVFCRISSAFWSAPFPGLPSVLSSSCVLPFLMILSLFPHNPTSTLMLLKTVKESMEF